MHTLPNLMQSRQARAAGGMLLLAVLGCGSSSHTSTSTTAMPAVSPRLYFAPYIAGTTNAGDGGVPVALTFPQTYILDDASANSSFSQATYALLPPAQQGSQVINAGVQTLGPRNLRLLGITANYVLNTSTNHYAAVTYMPPEAGSFAVELTGQAGGLLQLIGQPAAPLAAATQCPSSSKLQTYLYLTIPGPLAQPANSGTQFTWDPTAETAYGSVDISGSGSAVTLANISQHTLPSAGGSGTPAQPGATSASGACAPTFFGNTISVPGQLVVTAPGNNQSAPPQATVGIGPSGLLVESNFTPGGTSPLPGTSPGLFYNNVLGAGTGAVGLPKPGAPVDAAALASAQYLGFVYAAGAYLPGSSGNGAFSSHLASFGFATVPSSCGALAPTTPTTLYGGDFPQDNPAGSADGFGNCDFAIDLGAEDATTAGLFPAVQVTVGASYLGNTMATTYSFAAVAIAGKLGDKYAVFVLGSDTYQPWLAYLLQSN